MRPTSAQRADAVRLAGARADAIAAPTTSYGPGLPIAIIAVLGLITVATGSGLPVATGRTSPSTGIVGYTAAASVWTLCIANRDLVAENPTAEQRASALAEGCSRMETSICKEDAMPMAHLARFGHIGGCIVHAAILIFGILDRLSLFGSVPGNAATRNKRRLVSLTIVFRRRAYMIAGVVAVLFVLCGAIPSTRFLGFGCLGQRTSLEPGLIVQFIALIFGIVVVVVAAYHRDTPDYAAINRVLEEHNNRVKAPVPNYAHARAAGSAGAAAAVDMDRDHDEPQQQQQQQQRCVSSFVSDEEMQRVRDESLRNAGGRGGRVSYDDGPAPAGTDRLE